MKQQSQDLSSRPSKSDALHMSSKRIHLDLTPNYQSPKGTWIDEKPTSNIPNITLTSIQITGLMSQNIKGM